MANEVRDRMIKRELRYDGNVILTYEIHYPEMVHSQYAIGRKIFNEYNEQKVKELVKYAEIQMFQNAKEIYEYNKKHGYPIMVFELIQETKITKNEDQMISLYQDQYIFTGGAHGNTVRSSQNWNLEYGIQIPLYALYQDPYFLIGILKQINEQIEAQKENYFENSCSLVLQTFNPKSYYLTQDGIEIYFQQYDIAPYVTGIPTFQIKRK